MTSDPAFALLIAGAAVLSGAVAVFKWWKGWDYNVVGRTPWRTRRWSYSGTRAKRLHLITAALLFLAAALSLWAGFA